MKTFPVAVAISLALAASLPGTAHGQACNGLSLGGCTYDEESILSEWNIPNLPEAASLCQQLCQARMERCVIQLANNQTNLFIGGG